VGPRANLDAVAKKKIPWLREIKGILSEDSWLPGRERSVSHYKLN